MSANYNCNLCKYYGHGDGIGKMVHPKTGAIVDSNEVVDTYEFETCLHPCPDYDPFAGLKAYADAEADGNASLDMIGVDVRQTNGRFYLIGKEAPISWDNVMEKLTISMDEHLGHYRTDSNVRAFADLDKRGLLVAERAVSEGLIWNHGNVVQELYLDSLSDVETEICPSCNEEVKSVDVPECPWCANDMKKLAQLDHQAALAMGYSSYEELRKLTRTGSEVEYTLIGSIHNMSEHISYRNTCSQGVTAKGGMPFAVAKDVSFMSVRSLAKILYSYKTLKNNPTADPCSCGAPISSGSVCDFCLHEDNQDVDLSVYHDAASRMHPAVLRNASVSQLINRIKETSPEIEIVAEYYRANGLDMWKKPGANDVDYRARRAAEIDRAIDWLEGGMKPLREIEVIKTVYDRDRHATRVFVRKNGEFRTVLKTVEA